MSEPLNQGEEPVERFKNKKQALDWLHAQKYVVSNGKFYADCKKGTPPVGKDGSLSRYQVLLYGLSLERGSVGLEVVNTAEDDARKAKADADMAEMKAEAFRKSQSRVWVEADFAYAKIAAMVLAIKNALRYEFHQASREIVHAASGDQERSNEVYALNIQIVNRGLNAVSGQILDIEFGEDGGDGEDDDEEYSHNPA